MKVKVNNKNTYIYDDFMNNTIGNYVLSELQPIKLPPISMDLL